VLALNRKLFNAYLLKEKPGPADVELSPALDRRNPLVTTGAVPETVI
jgi:hypothetical protein